MFSIYLRGECYVVIGAVSNLTVEKNFIHHPVVLFKNKGINSCQHNYIVCSIYLCNMFEPQLVIFRLNYY
jgi:hypothetical protein